MLNKPATKIEEIMFNNRPEGHKVFYCEEHGIHTCKVDECPICKCKSIEVELKQGKIVPKK